MPAIHKLRREDGRKPFLPFPWLLFFRWPVLVAVLAVLPGLAGVPSPAAAARPASAGTVAVAGEKAALSPAPAVPTPAMPVLTASELPLLPRLAEGQPRMQDSLRLSQFSAQAGPLRLGQTASSTDLFIALSPMVQVRDTVIDLHFSHSIALQGKRSYLLVRFNEASLAQVPYDPAQPLAEARIRLPADLWRPGFNKLTLGVVQHYADRCEDSEAPELWTELDLYNSTLSYQLEQVSRPLVSGDIGGLFSPGLGGQEKVTLLTAPDAAGSVVEEQALPLVAAALALRRQFAPLQIAHRRWPAALPAASGEADSGSRYLQADERRQVHVLVGTTDQLAPLLPAGRLQGVQGPWLGIERLAGPAPVTGPATGPTAGDAGKGGDDSKGQPATIRLLVTGRTGAEVREAARVLGEMDDAVNQTDSFTVLDRQTQKADISPAHGRVLHGGRTWTFHDMGMTTTTMQGAGSHFMRVSIEMPPDFYTDESSQADLLLDFGYGAGMGASSIMNVVLNGEYIHGMSFSDPSGAAFRGYRISVPVRRLHPGNNTLDFQLTLRQQLPVGECVGVRGQHLMVQFRDSSRLKLPDFGGAAIQPNLELFRQTAWPYLSPDRRENGTLVAGSDSQTGIALTLAGKLAQVAGTPPGELILKTGISDQTLKGRVLLVATPQQLPEDLFSHWEAAVGKSVRWPYRVMNDLRKETRGESENPLQSLGEILLDRPLPEAAEAPPPVLRGSVTQDGGLGEMGAMAAFRNPREEQRDETLTLITAGSDALLARRMENLTGAAVWSQIQGDLVLWKDSSDPVVTLRVAEHFEVGNKSRWLLLRLFLSNNPWYWLASVVAASLLVIFSARIALRRRRAKMERGVK